MLFDPLRFPPGSGIGVTAPFGRQTQGVNISLWSTDLDQVFGRGGWGGAGGDIMQSWGRHYARSWTVGGDEIKQGCVAKVWERRRLELVRGL